MTTPATVTAPVPPQGGAGGQGRTPRRRGDKAFAGLAIGAGIAIVVVLAGVALFLLLEGAPAVVEDPAGFMRYTAPLLAATVYCATLALVVATPLSVGIALFISHYAPRRVATTLGYLVDLLAAVPSIVFGLWGANFLALQLRPVYPWLEENLGFLPFFGEPVSNTGRTYLLAGLVLAVMILPIMTALCREVFLQTPRLHEEAALALGATRWEMIRTAVLPYGRSGIISAAMLGLGRALGETLAVALVLSASGQFSFNLISQANAAPIAPNIALQFPEATGLTINLLIATGLVLFVLTFAVNFAARAIIARRKDFSGAAG